MRFVNPKNDIAFKKIFGNEQKKEILISFLNAVLELRDDKEIQTIDILNPYQSPQTTTKKESVLDIIVKDRQGITFIVEMQVENLAGLMKRFTYYTAKTYSSQMKRGDSYSQLKPVIFIGILDFAYFEGGDDDYLTHHLILNKATLKQELKDLEFTFIELHKFNKKEDELNSILEKWVYFIKHASDLDIIPESVDTKPLREAYKIANEFDWTEKELALYDFWSMKARDEQAAMELVVEEAKQAIEEAKQSVEEAKQAVIQAEQAEQQAKQAEQQAKQAEQQAVIQAEQQAVIQAEQAVIQAEQAVLQERKKARQEKLKIASGMIKQGLDKAVVAQLTGLSSDELDSLSDE